MIGLAPLTPAFPHPLSTRLAMCVCARRGEGVRGRERESYPDLSRDYRPAGVKVQGVQAGTAGGLGVEECGGTAEGMQQQLHCVQLRI